MAVLIERHVFEIVPATTMHAHVQVFCDDGELWIKQGDDSISIGPAAAKLVAVAIGKLTAEDQ